MGGGRGCPQCASLYHYVLTNTMGIYTFTNILVLFKGNFEFDFSKKITFLKILDALKS